MPIAIPIIVGRFILAAVFVSVSVAIVVVFLVWADNRFDGDKER